MSPIARGARLFEADFFLPANSSAPTTPPIHMLTSFLFTTGGCGRFSGTSWLAEISIVESFLSWRLAMLLR